MGLVSSLMSWQDLSVVAACVLAIGVFAHRLSLKRRNRPRALSVGLSEKAQTKASQKDRAPGGE